MTIHIWNIGGKKCQVIENYPLPEPKQSSNPIPIPSQAILKRTPSNNLVESSGSLPNKICVGSSPSDERTIVELFSEAYRRGEKPLIGINRWTIQV